MLVDMNLGDMTGIELARALARPRDRALPPGRAVGRRAARADPRGDWPAGFESYLTKPINFEEVLAVLDAHQGRGMTCVRPNRGAHRRIRRASRGLTSSPITDWRIHDERIPPHR